MTWTPPLDDGLARGDRYLAEDIESVGSTPTEARQPGVYILQCSLPGDTSLIGLRDRWYKYADIVPPYLEQLPGRDTVYYVGASNDVYGRLVDHLERDVRSVTFLKVFPPHHVEDVVYLDDPWTRESGVAIDFQNRHPEAYVHSR